MQSLDNSQNGSIVSNDWNAFSEITSSGDRCYNEPVTKLYILLEYGLIPGLDEFEHNN